MPDGVDVSRNQGVRSGDWFAQWDFAIVRCMDRHGVPDSLFEHFWTAAAGRCLRGAYGWPRPGADNFALGRRLAELAGDAELGLWADFEHTPEYGLASVAELEAFLDGIGDVRKGVYANAFECPYGSIADQYPWWVANYGGFNDGERHPFAYRDPRTDEIIPIELQRPWSIHQFTSLGGPDGGPLDRDYAPTLDLWRPAMRNAVYPEAEWMPGRNAHYAAGRTPVESVVCHYTVGRNSTGIGLQGYFHFLVRRDGGVEQYCQVDAVAWHAGSPWNGLGPGIEVEFLPGYDDELWTPPQREAVARLVEWLHDEWGVPYDFYDGPRIASHAGFITHRSLIQTGDQHSDWWPELPRTTDTPPLEEDDDVKLLPFLIEAKGGQWVYDPRTHSAKPFGSEKARDLWVAIFVFDFGHEPAIRNDAQAVALLEDAIR